MNMKNMEMNLRTTEKVLSPGEKICQLANQFGFIENHACIKIRTNIENAPETLDEEIGKWFDSAQEIVNNLGNGDVFEKASIGMTLISATMYLRADLLEDADNAFYDAVDCAQGRGFYDLKDQIVAIAREVGVDI